MKTRTNKEFLRERPAIRRIQKMYLWGLPVSLMAFVGVGKPGACVVMMGWGIGMVFRLGRRWEADTDERQMVLALSACAIFFGFVGLMGWA